MSDQAPAGPTDDLETYLARQTVLYQLRDAIDRSDSWEAFRQDLERSGLPEARIRQIVAVPVPMDLHLHSTSSDGRVPARKLAWLARAIGLETIALADHDSISGTRALYSEATLLGVGAIPAVELSTEWPGLEILVYFPDAGRFFDFLTTRAGAQFEKYLERKQAEVHETTLKVLESVNRWLKRRGIPADGLLSVEELDAFFGGVKPYYPGTLCVLGLARLSREQRDELGIADPREFNTKVVTPAIKRLKGTSAVHEDIAEATAEARRRIAAIRRAGTESVAILSHPKEMVSKGKMSLGKVAGAIEYLAAKGGVDGIEIGTARDGEADVRIWNEITAEINSKIEAGRIKAPGPLVVASYSSDFHVLAPGRATGEITLGFGILDERAEFRCGNLRPQTGPDELIEAMRRRAAARAGA
jgi:hypothetical protein